MRSSSSIGLLLAAVVLAAALAGCGASAPRASDPREIQTDSDRTDAARRAGTRLELAGAYFAQGKALIALDEVKLALQADPNSGAAYNLRGLIYASLGDDAMAEDSFQRALQLNPRDGELLHNIGWFRCERRRYDEADALFRRALEQPLYQEGQRTLLAEGVCQARAQKLEAAQATLQRAFDLNPANSAVSVNLAEVLLRRGDLERARFYIQRVNGVTEQNTAQTLWLALRIEQRAGNREHRDELGNQLRNRFPDSREAAAYARGQFDE